MPVTEAGPTETMADPSLAVPDADPSYINPDIAPVPLDRRKWGTNDIAALWISMSACIPTYMLASSLIAEGMNWWQAVLTIFLGNVIVLIPMVLNAHAGTKYGIPFPVYCRASFGLLGANVPAMLRALVACGWFGIQTWIGGAAIYKILAIYVPSWQSLPRLGGLGINAAELACFLGFWLTERPPPGRRWVRQSAESPTPLNPKETGVLGPLASPVRESHRPLMQRGRSRRTGSLRLEGEGF